MAMNAQTSTLVVIQAPESTQIAVPGPPGTSDSTPLLGSFVFEHESN